MPKECWMKKLTGGGKTVIVLVDVGLSCKTYFVLGMLHTFSSLISRGSRGYLEGYRRIHGNKN